MTKQNRSDIVNIMYILGGLMAVLEGRNTDCTELAESLEEEKEEEDQDEKKILDFYEKDFKTA